MKTKSHDQIFSEEFKEARSEFGREHVEHGVSFFDETHHRGVNRIMLIDLGVEAYDYIRSRENLKLHGVGSFEGQGIHAAKVKGGKA